MDLATRKIEDLSDAFSVSVAVRIRPLNNTEKIESPQICVTPIPEQNIVVVGKDRQFVFDKVFGMESSQSEVFQGCTHELVKSCFAGYNATVLAYGQTGSGKTFTMGSGQRLNILKEDLGIIPRVIDMIFDEIEARKGKSEFMLKVSFLEIYNEEIHDLLDPNRMVPDKQITIREDKGSIYLMGLHEEKVTSYEEMASCLDKGGMHRSTASTLMNAQSSRSHAIFTISIEQHVLEDQITGEKVEDETQEYMTAKFHFVDLAGSERAKRTGASGATLKEGININKGLLCLGNVISALTEDSKKNAHVPYRDSKLTRILQDSLGGNSRTFMIACVSPALINFDETLNALKYASRARHIKNKPIVNRDPNSAMIAQLKLEVYQLKQEVKNFERLFSANSGGDLRENLQLLKQSDIESEEEIKRNKLRVQQMDRKLDQMHSEIETYKLDSQSLSIEKMEIMKDRDLLKIQLECAVQLLKEHGIECDMPQQSSLIDDYNNRIGGLLSELRQQKYLYDELRQDYDKLIKTSERDNELLMQKNQELEKLRRMMHNRCDETVNSDVIQERIKRSMTDFGRRFAENVLASIEKPHSPERTEVEMNSLSDVLEEELPEEELKEQEEKLKVKEEQLSSVESNIKEKEDMLKNIEMTFKDMQTKLVDEMSQQYYKKIEELESELRQTERERDVALDKVSKTSSSTTEKQTVAERYKQKIQMLEDRLKENRRKEREQNSLHKLVEAQKQQIGRLAEEIRKAKQQKVSLSRKIREEAEAYQKWKTTRQKEMIQMKRQSLQKDREIQKLLSENRKKDILAKRKTEELAALQKRQRDIAMRRKRDMKTEQETLQTWVNQYTIACVTEKETAEKLETEMNEKQSLEEEIEKLQDSYAKTALEVEKVDMQLNGQDLPGNEEMLQAKSVTGKQEMAELNEQLEVLEEKLKFKLQLIEEYTIELANSQMEDIKSKSLTINSMTEAQILITALFDEIMNKATRSKKLEKIVNEKQIYLDSIQHEIDTQMIEKNYILSNHHLEMLRMRQEYDEKEKVLIEELEDTKNRYRVIVPDDIDGNRRIEEMECREKEYQDIIEQYKKKLDAVSGKYRKLRKQCEDMKDSSLGQDEDAKKKPQSSAFTSLSRAREAAKKVRYNQKKAQQDQEEEIKQPRRSTTIRSIVRTKSNSQQDEDESVFERLANSSGKKKSLENVEESVLQLKQKWKNLISIEAHNGAISSMAIHENILYSASNKTFKVWSLDGMNLISEVPAHNSFIRALAVWPENSLIVTGCNNVINIWDTISLQPLATLKGHNEEVRAIYMKDQLLYTAGKSTNNGYGLFIWDLRQAQTPLVERERNQDIFTLLEHENTLYYGCRNHRVGRINLETCEILRSFDPPHFDAVTSLSIYNNLLISGSRDKNLRAWDIVNVNPESTIIEAHNDWVQDLKTDITGSLLYSAGKEGKIRSWKGSPMSCVGEISAHSSAISCIATLPNEPRTLASAGQDKYLKLWKMVEEEIECD